MKKTIAAAAVAALVLGLSGTALAAELDNLEGQSCGDFAGEWHFVQNQIPLDSGVCAIFATFSSGDSCDVLAGLVNRRMQHFYCTGTGELLGAETDCEGHLVLSDFSCESKEPPCDGKDCEPDPK